MPKYLIQASYTTDGVKGLIKDGGTRRRAAVEALMKELGGRVEAFYYAFGDADVYVIVDGLDNVLAAAASLAISASGAASMKTTPLLTPEEIDQDDAKDGHLSPPGR